MSCRHLGKRAEQARWSYRSTVSTAQMTGLGQVTALRAPGCPEEVTVAVLDHSLRWPRPPGVTGQ